MCLQVMNLIGDVKGKVAVMVDDMIDTAGELRNQIYCLLFLFCSENGNVLLNGSFKETCLISYLCCRNHYKRG